MKFAPKTASALVLASTLALAACGGGAEVSDEPGGDETEAAVGSGASETAATPAAGESPTPAAAPSETPSATPSPTPTPSATAAAATVAAKPPEFAVCAACHSTEPGKNGIGPTLAGVFGAKAGHISGFEYSEQMKSSGLTWNQGNLDRYLTDPKGVVPGTKMAYAGLKDAAKRQAMIAYLRGL